jgi:glycosyl transferase family 87
MRWRVTRGPRDLVVAAWCALSVGILAVAPLRALRDADRTDYVAFATAGRILRAGSQCIYCYNTEAAAQAGVVGHVPSIGINIYANPPLAAWMLQPVSALDLQTGLLAFLLVGVAGLVAAGVCTWRLLDRLPLRERAAMTVSAIAVLPGSEAIAFGQWDPILLGGLFASLLIARRGDAFAAGLVLATLWDKPQVVWLAVPILLVTGRRRMLGGLLSGGALWLTTGVAIAGPGAASDWWTSVTAVHVGETSRGVGIPALVADLTGWNPAAFLAAAILGVAGVALAQVLARRHGADDVALVACAVGLSVVLAPHVYDTDLLLLAAPLAATARSASGQAILLAVSMGVAHLLAGSGAPGVTHLEALVAAFVALSPLLVAGPLHAVAAPGRAPAVLAGGT